MNLHSVSTAAERMLQDSREGERGLRRRGARASAAPRSGGAIAGGLAGSAAADGARGGAAGPWRSRRNLDRQGRAAQRRAKLQGGHKSARALNLLELEESNRNLVQR